MIEVTLKDPGMHNKYVSVSTSAEVPAVLNAHNRTYTRALLYNTKTGKTTVYFRKVGERWWRR